MRKIDSITSFESERAGILISFGAHLDFNRHYNAYLAHCKRKKFTPVSKDAFIPISNRIITGLRDWWNMTEVGIYISEEGLQ